MVEVEVYEIDNKDYILLNKTEIAGEIYLYLVNEENENDFLLRKVDKNDPTCIIPLENEQEVEKASLLLVNKELSEI